MPARPAPGRARRFAWRLINYVERKARGARRRLLPVLPARGPIVPEGLTPEVVLYFAEVPARLYQVAQWLAPMERLAADRPVAIVVRRVRTYDALVERTSLPVIYVPLYSQLLACYDALDPKVVVYVNHGMRNFQSLTLRTAMHVHVNHGESDKLSSFSNQAKAYDRVFVAGELAAERYLRRLLDFDERRVVRVGRPQLDLLPAPVLPASPRRTVLYAPTWQGESEDNNWCSVDVLGEEIVRQLLLVPDVRVAYKPHPRVPRSLVPEVARGHEAILGLLTAAAAADPAAGHGHIDSEGDILGVLPSVDALVTDVSSVALDFLYLRSTSPMFLTDRRNDPIALAVATPLAEAADVVDVATVHRLGALVASRLEADLRLGERMALRGRYFGALGPGDSTVRFLAAVGELCAARDRRFQTSPGQLV
ncbi:MAG: CDP-glycerol glycerophosphotransferase family protein [Actinomycetota bacterium]|nr:CDP-glycerol glycerophosphotransferase family protein [Actinomycetota bacterium]